MFQCFHFLYGGVFSSHTAPTAPSRSPPPPFHRSPLAASSPIPRSGMSAESPSGGSRPGHPSSSPAMSGSVEVLPPHGPSTLSPGNHRRCSFNGPVRAARLGIVWSWDDSDSDDGKNNFSTMGATQRLPCRHMTLTRTSNLTISEDTSSEECGGRRVTSMKFIV